MQESKKEHLSMIQGIINRMAANSFMIKGWSITLISALFVLSSKDANQNYAFIALLPAISFWILDAFYLQLERRYRKLYEQVQKDYIDSTDIIKLFDMNLDNYKEICKVERIPRLMFSKSVGWIHVVIFSIVLIFCITQFSVFSYFSKILSCVVACK